MPINIVRLGVLRERTLDWNGAEQPDGAELIHPLTCGEVRAVADTIERLHQEIEVLRRYGNKDCTAMADAALEQKRETGKFPFED